MNKFSCMSRNFSHKLNLFPDVQIHWEKLNEKQRGTPMLSETLSEGLENYRIGMKIRNLRKLKDMGLAQLGDHTGLSAGMLSKIERGQVVPTLPTLLRIALVFGVALDHFFSPEDEQPLLSVVRKGDRSTFDFGKPNSTSPTLVNSSSPIASKFPVLISSIPAALPSVMILSL